MYQLYKTTDNLDIIIRDDDGSTYMTARSYSEMMSVNRSDILSRLQKEIDKSVFVTKVQTELGDKMLRLIPESVFITWMKNDQPLTYQELILGVGIRTHLHELVNFKMN